MEDSTFAEWYEEFKIEVKKYGWKPDFDEIDESWAFDEWQEFAREPYDAANIYVMEMKTTAPQDFKSYDEEEV